jgi:hypothetical protein
MATGTLPFRGESSGVIFDGIMNRAPLPPLRLNPDLPPRLEDIISRALEKDRELRYQHASDMRSELQRLKRDTQSGFVAAASAGTVTPAGSGAMVAAQAAPSAVVMTPPPSKGASRGRGRLGGYGGERGYAGYQPFRPIFWDFNGIWAPAVGSHFTPELLAGIGVETVRFYQPYFVCGGFGCTNYTSQSQFMGDFGGGFRFYATHSIFVRPEARLYLIHNNYLFSSGHATRYGVSIGYSFGGR